jgi:hypothetical protein
MARTFIRQDTQIRKSDAYTDNIVPSLANYETNTVNIEDDLNSLRSQVHNLLKNFAGNWYDDLNVPSALDTGSERGVNDLNTDLHAIERKRVLVTTANLSDVTVGAGNNFVVLALGELPSNTTAAIGSVTTTGTVAAYNASFGSNSLAEVSGSTAISPKNLCGVYDASTRDPVLSSNRVVYALFQTESNTDGSTMTGTTPNRAQLSFVRINSTGDDLEAVPFADIENKVINYTSVTRKALEDLTEQDFLKGAEVDVPSSAVVTRQVSYDNQGATAVNLTNNATLDLEGAGLYWEIRDDLEATLFKITEGSAGGTTTLLVSGDVDTFDSSAVINDFDQGIRVDTGGQRINVGETAGLIESTSTNDLRILGAGELYLDDGNQTGSTWAQTSGIKLSDTTAEWNAFEANFGEVSLLAAINASYAKDRAAKVYSNVTVTTVSDSNVSLAAGNLDVALPDMSTGSFTVDYDVYLNGELLRPGADASANNDYYPGSTLTPAAELKFEFAVKLGDVLCVIPYRQP